MKRSQVFILRGGNFASGSFGCSGLSVGAWACTRTLVLLGLATSDCVPAQPKYRLPNGSGNRSRCVLPLLCTNSIPSQWALITHGITK